MACWPREGHDRDTCDQRRLGSSTASVPHSRQFSRFAVRAEMLAWWVSYRMQDKITDEAWGLKPMSLLRAWAPHGSDRDIILSRLDVPPSPYPPHV